MKHLEDYNKNPDFTTIYLEKYSDEYYEFLAFEVVGL
jgi:hypothetical protein